MNRLPFLLVLLPGCGTCYGCTAPLHDVCPAEGMTLASERSVDRLEATTGNRYGITCQGDATELVWRDDISFGYSNFGKNRIEIPSGLRGQGAFLEGMILHEMGHFVALTVEHSHTGLMRSAWKKDDKLDADSLRVICGGATHCKWRKPE